MNRPGIPLRTRMRLPRFRAKNFSTCTRSPTARGSSHASHSPWDDVAFSSTERDRHLGIGPVSQLNTWPVVAESARGIAPRAALRSGLDTLASSGSCHHWKATAFRREMGLLPPPNGFGWPAPTSVTHPLRSAGITPASSLLRGSPPLSGASVLSASRLVPLVPFPLASPARFSSSVRKPR